jgi:hypothetical protein
MKKVFIALLLGVTCLMCSCVYTADSETPKRFEYVDRGYYGWFDVVRDTKTGVMYAVSQEPYNYGTVTLLVNADGSPLLYEEYIK